MIGIVVGTHLFFFPDGKRLEAKKDLLPFFSEWKKIEGEKQHLLTFFFCI